MIAEMNENLGTATDSEHVVENDVHSRNCEAVCEMIGDGEIHSENEENDNNSIEKRLLEATTVEAVESHGNEGDSDEWPFTDHCNSTDKQSDKVVVETHPHSIRKEH